VTEVTIKRLDSNCIFLESEQGGQMERETGIEPATSSLGSWRSTAELLPLTVRQVDHYTSVPCPRRFCSIIPNSRFHSRFHQLFQDSALSFELVGLEAVCVMGKHVKVCPSEHGPDDLGIFPVRHKP
jgi:hypothetical protein